MIVCSRIPTAVQINSKAACKIRTLSRDVQSRQGTGRDAYHGPV